MKRLRMGQTAALTRSFSEEDVAAYRALSEDQGLDFGGETAGPGPLLGSLFSQLLGTRLPGRGTNWLKQSLHFPRPARLEEAITATVEIIRLRPEKDLVNLRTTCINPAGETVCIGEALVLVKDLETTRP